MHYCPCGGLLPRPFNLTFANVLLKRYISVALSLGLLQPDVIWYLVSMKPGLSSPTNLTFRGAAVRQPVVCDCIHFTLILQVLSLWCAYLFQAFILLIFSRVAACFLGYHQELKKLLKKITFFLNWRIRRKPLFTRRLTICSFLYQEQNKNS